MAMGVCSHAVGKRNLGRETGFVLNHLLRSPRIKGSLKGFTSAAPASQCRKRGTARDPVPLEARGPPPTPLLQPLS